MDLVYPSGSPPRTPWPVGGICCRAGPGTPAGDQALFMSGVANGLLPAQECEHLQPTMGLGVPLLALLLTSIGAAALAVAGCIALSRRRRGEGGGVPGPPVEAAALR